MKHTKDTRRKARNRYNKPLNENVTGLFVQTSGRPFRNIVRNLTASNRHGRRAMHRLFPISKRSMKIIKKIRLAV